MKKKKQNKSSSISAGKAILFIIGIFFGAVLAGFVKTSELDVDLQSMLVSLIVFLVALYVVSYVTIIVHEAGHLVFGLISGYKFSSFRIASFMLVNDNGKIRLKRHRIAGTGGQCLMVPPDIKDGKIPVTMYNLGGCIMNLIFSAMLLIARAFVADNIVFSSGLLVFAIVGIFAALTNGIPIHTSNIDNDGYNAFALRGNAEAMRGLWVQLKCVEQTSKGVRLKDMPDEWFDIPSDEAMTNSMVAARGVFICERLVDAGKYEEADALIAHMLEIKSGIVGIHRNLLICERIFIELITKNRREVVDGFLSQELKRFMKLMKKYPTVVRTEYALALLYYKDKSESEKIIRRFEKIAKTHPYPCEIQGEKELIRIINDTALIKV